MGKMVPAVCKKCREKFHFDISNLNAEEAKKNLAEQDKFECPSGSHTEPMSPLDACEIDWEHIMNEEESKECYYENSLKALFPNALKCEELKDYYKIVSIIDSMCLCEDINSHVLTAFFIYTSPMGVKYFVPQTPMTEEEIKKELGIEDLTTEQEQEDEEKNEDD